MSDQPNRRIEITVQIRATPEELWPALTEAAGLMNWFPPKASVSAPGVGGVITYTWGEGVDVPVTCTVWEPGRRLTLSDTTGWAGPALITDYVLEGQGGTTTLRFVNSGFGLEAEWDEVFDAMKAGWGWFFTQLRLLFEHHRGRTRHCLSHRVASHAGREAGWQRITGDAAGWVRRGSAPLAVGTPCRFQLTDDLDTPAVVECVSPGRVLGLRLPEQQNALVMIEAEPAATEGHIGYWLSVYDAAQADALRGRIEAPFQRALAS